MRITKLDSILVCLLAGMVLGSSGGGPGGKVASDASLSSLVPSTGVLTPAFSPGTYAYTVGPGICDGAVRVTPTTSEAGATITVNSAPTPSGTASPAFALPITVPTAVSITVTGTNGVTQQTYTVTYTRTGPTLHEAYVKASNTEADDHFGWSVAVTDDSLVAGAYAEDSNAVGVGGAQGNNTAGGSGAAYVVR